MRLMRDARAALLDGGAPAFQRWSADWLARYHSASSASPAGSAR
jgi:hypothetical protein